MSDSVAVALDWVRVAWDGRADAVRGIVDVLDGDLVLDCVGVVVIVVAAVDVTVTVGGSSTRVRYHGAVTVNVLQEVTVPANV